MRLRSAFFFLVLLCTGVQASAWAPDSLLRVWNSPQHARLMRQAEVAGGAPYHPGPALVAASRALQRGDRDGACSVALNVLHEGEERRDSAAIGKSFAVLCLALLEPDYDRRAVGFGRMALAHLRAGELELRSEVLDAIYRCHDFHEQHALALKALKERISVDDQLAHEERVTNDVLAVQRRKADQVTRTTKVTIEALRAEQARLLKLEEEQGRTIILLGLLSLLIATALVLVVVRYRGNRQRARQRQEAMLDRERLRAEAMQRELEHVKQRERLQRERALQEERALRVQHYPHLVSNALTSVHVKLNEGDTEGAARMLELLEQLLRIELRNIRKEEVSLKDELLAVDTYVKMKRRTVPGRLKYKVELADDIVPASVMVSPGTLQPLIENAIKHGARGTVKLKARRQNNDLVFVVENELPATDEHVADTGANNRISTANIGRRMELLKDYLGDGGALEGVRTENGYTATLRQPWRTKDD